MMTKAEATEEACAVFALAYHAMGDYSQPADGFCGKCPNDESGYQNAGEVFDYVMGAVIEQLRRDGYSVSSGFDPITGREIK